MGKEVRRICTVLARGGSKGVKNKNIRPLLGKPLIVHTLEQAKTSGLFSAVAVSSDSDEILRVAGESGITLLVKRPAELASDSAPKLNAIQHCIDAAKEMAGTVFDIVVDLDPTSPLRLIEDIRGATALLEEKLVSNVLTGAQARRSPYFNLIECDSLGHAQLSKQPNTPLTRRQDSPRCYDLNASIYPWHYDALMRAKTIFQKDTLFYLMPEERSIDIDNELDFEIVEFMLKRRNGAL